MFTACGLGWRRGEEGITYECHGDSKHEGNQGDTGEEPLEGEFGDEGWSEGDENETAKELQRKDSRRYPTG